jgi:hypothetical protein
MLLLLIPYAAVLILAIFELSGALSNRAIRTPSCSAWFWMFAIVVSYGIQLLLMRYAATHATPLKPWRLSMPVPALHIVVWHGKLVSAAFLVAGGAQSYALLALYRSRVSRTIVAAGFAILVVMSVLAPALASFDSYLYAWASVAGTRAWLAAPVPLSGDFHVIDLWFGKPGAFLAYGPLWFVIVHLVCALPATLLGKILALRVFGALLMASLLIAMRALGLPRRFLTVTALNPGLMFQFVANAHNDLIAILIVTLAAAVIRRSPTAGVGLIAVAGLVKIPFVLLGLPVLAVLRPAARTRYVGGVAAIVAVLVVSWLGGGSAYWQALTYHATVSRAQTMLHVLPVFLAIAAIAVAFAGGRRLISANWLIPAIGGFGLPVIFPWYLIWALPYGLARHRVLGALLVAFPFATAALVQELPLEWAFFFAIPLAVVVAYRTPARLVQAFSRGESASG